jgi:hypothetical protein
LLGCVNVLYLHSFPGGTPFPAEPTTAYFFLLLLGLGLRRGEFGHGLGSFTDSVLGKFTGKHQTNSGLDFTTGKSCLFVVGGELSSFSGNAIKDILDERVHDAHALFADTGIGMDLFEDLVNVTSIRFGTFGTLALATGGCLFGGCRLGTGLFGGCLGHLFGGANGGNETKLTSKEARVRYSFSAGSINVYGLT